MNFERSFERRTRKKGNPTRWPINHRIFHDSVATTHSVGNKGRSRCLLRRNPDVGPLRPSFAPRKRSKGWLWSITRGWRARCMCALVFICSFHRFPSSPQSIPSLAGSCISLPPLSSLSLSLSLSLTVARKGKRQKGEKFPPLRVE